MSNRIGRHLAGMFVCMPALLSTTACAINAKYAPPQTPTPAAYREPPPSGWTSAQPNDAALRGEWWRLFNEPALDALENQVSI